MKGSKCKCGFATEGDRTTCPRCSRFMTKAEWPDEGEILSFTELEVTPERLDTPQNLVMVEVKNGPKVICWSPDKLAVGQEVFFEGDPGKRTCRPRT